MRTYSITAAKPHLSRLVEQAAKGEPFLITKFGKPMVKVVALNSPEPPQKNRFGFMTGQIKAPDDFNTMGARKVQRLFEANSNPTPATLIPSAPSPSRWKTLLAFGLICKIYG